MKHRLYLPAALAVAIAAACADPGGSPTLSSVQQPRAAGGGTSGAIFTTGAACDGTDLNIYANKADVYVDGGPAHPGAAGLPDGDYYIQVTTPSGTLLGTSVGTATPQPVHVVGGEFQVCYQLAAVVHKASSPGDAGYDDTDNAGGEYKVWVSRASDFSGGNTKTDNFKVKPAVVDLPEVAVTKTADSWYERAYRWSVDKSADASTVTLAPGQSKTVNYSVVVTNTGSVDRNFSVSGTITITNQKEVDATITSVTDVTDFGPADQVDCALPVTLHHVGDTLTCTYTQALAQPPVAFGTGYGNTAKAFVADPQGGSDLEFTGTAGFSFDASAPNSEVDKCINASDTFAGALGQVCVGDSPKTFTYGRTFGPGRIGDCGKTYNYPNTASLSGTEANGSDSWGVDVSYVCGCTPGYWKNNTAGWPVPTGTLESSPFPNSTLNPPYLLNGKTLGQYTLLQGLAFQGNSTVEGGAEILLRAATAAYLNASKFGYALSVGDVTSQVNAALATKDRATLIALAGQLDAYNNAGCPLNAKGSPINP
ncbi:MAG TPA: hypothetical protein VF092_20240 [Longimicrobium sp.]